MARRARRRLPPVDPRRQTRITLRRPRTQPSNLAPSPTISALPATAGNEPPGRLPAIQHHVLSALSLGGADGSRFRASRRAFDPAGPSRGKAGPAGYPSGGACGLFRAALNSYRTLNSPDCATFVDIEVRHDRYPVVIRRLMRDTRPPGDLRHLCFAHGVVGCSPPDGARHDKAPDRQDAGEFRGFVVDGSTVAGRLRRGLMGATLRSGVRVVRWSGQCGTESPAGREVSRTPCRRLGRGTRHVARAFVDPRWRRVIGREGVARPGPDPCGPARPGSGVGRRGRRLRPADQPDLRRSQRTASAADPGGVARDPAQRRAPARGTGSHERCRRHARCHSGRPARVPRFRRTPR